MDLKAYHRQILLLGLFRTRSGDISGFKKFWLQQRAIVLPEPNEFFTKYNKASVTKDVVIRFTGAKDQFHLLQDRESFLQSELHKITKKKWLDHINKVGVVPIGINVRLGNDFKLAKTSQDYYTKGFLKTPLQWFIDSLQAIRKKVGYPARAVVVSDGSKEDLKGLLDLENVVFLRPGCAISDLLILANTKVLLASGNSSFSAWASFLGQMPTISHPGQSLTWFQLSNRKGYYIGEFDPILPNEIVLEQIESVLKH